MPERAAKQSWYVTDCVSAQINVSTRALLRIPSILFTRRRREGVTVGLITAQYQETMFSLLCQQASHVAVKFFVGFVTC